LPLPPHAVVAGCPVGVQDKTIQAVMRHSNLNTTMNVYVKAVDADAVAAMKALDALMCAERAPGAAVLPRLV